MPTSLPFTKGPRVDSLPLASRIGQAHCSCISHAGHTKTRDKQGFTEECLNKDIVKFVFTAMALVTVESLSTRVHLVELLKIMRNIYRQNFGTSDVHPRFLCSTVLTTTLGCKMWLEAPSPAFYMLSVCNE